MSEPPKVFISYAWTDNDYRNRVVKLGQRLIDSRIQVLLDVWDLPVGGDKFRYMEEAVNNPEVDKVLILCNSRYKTKADERDGGVGEETTIIAPHIFREKALSPKFIPILFEPSDTPEEMIPAILQSKIYIDLSDDLEFETNFEKLRRIIHGKPEYQKPPLGPMPEFIDDTAGRPHLSALVSVRNDLTSLLNREQNKGRTRILCRKYTDLFLEVLSSYEISTVFPNPDTDYEEAKQLLTSIEELIHLRDEYLNFLTITSEYNAIHEVEFSDMFEKIYNAILKKKTDNARRSVAHMSIFLWEVIISTVVYCLHNHYYNMVEQIVNRTYFLIYSSDNPEFIQEYSIAEFRPNEQQIQKYLKYIDIEVNKKREYKLSYTADILLDRETPPVYVKSSICFADFIIYWLTTIYFPDKFPWFPITYIYAKGNVEQFISKMKSKAFCQSVLPLFNVSNLDELKTLFKGWKPEREIGYRNSFRSPVDFFRFFNPEELGTIP